MAYRNKSPTTIRGSRVLKSWIGWRQWTRFSSIQALTVTTAIVFSQRRNNSLIQRAKVRSTQVSSLSTLALYSCHLNQDCPSFIQPDLFITGRGTSLRLEILLTRWWQCQYRSMSLQMCSHLFKSTKLTKCLWHKMRWWTNKVRDKYLKRHLWRVHQLISHYKLMEVSLS